MLVLQELLLYIFSKKIFLILFPEILFQIPFLCYLELDVRFVRVITDLINLNIFIAFTYCANSVFRDIHVIKK